MSNKENPKKPQRRSHSMLRYGGMGFQMLTVILLAAWGGHWLDGHFQTMKPYWTIGCGFGGVILGIALAILDVKRLQ